MLTLSASIITHELNRSNGLVSGRLTRDCDGYIQIDEPTLDHTVTLDDNALGSIRVPRVTFGVSPNRAFRRDAGNCTRGRVRSREPEHALRSAFTVPKRLPNRSLSGKKSAQRPSRVSRDRAHVLRGRSDGCRRRGQKELPSLRLLSPFERRAGRE